MRLERFHTIETVKLVVEKELRRDSSSRNYRNNLFGAPPELGKCQNPRIELSTTFSSFMFRVTRSVTSTAPYRNDEKTGQSVKFRWKEVVSLGLRRCVCFDCERVEHAECGFEMFVSRVAQHMNT